MSPTRQFSFMALSYKHWILAGSSFFSSYSRYDLNSAVFGGCAEPYIKSDTMVHNVVEEGLKITTAFYSWSPLFQTFRGNQQQQGFHSRLEARYFTRSFSIPCPVFWFQYLRDFLITQAISKAINWSFKFGVIQLSRDKQMRLTESWIY